MNDLNIDLLKMNEIKLSIDQVFILHLLDNGMKPFISEYLKIHGPIFDKVRIQELVKRGFIKLRVLAFVNFSDLSITEEGKAALSEITNNDPPKLLKSEEELIKELADTYPKKAGIRKGLQSNKDSWSKKYIKLLKKNPDLRETILKCIKEEVEYRTKTMQMEFMPMLSTYINQRRWEIYEEELKNKQKKKDKSEREVYGNKIF